MKTRCMNLCSGWWSSIFFFSFYWWSLIRCTSEYAYLGVVDHGKDFILEVKLMESGQDQEWKKYGLKAETGETKS
jgi:hypothetical protein